MDYDLLLKALIAMAPVLILLLVFDRLDVFNLIPLRDIALLTLAGGLIAALTFFANWRVLDGFPIGFSYFSRYVAPIIEESLKALPIVALFAMNRLGFKLDAAIAGFAIGAGFSMVENAWYLLALVDANVSAWLVRGFGTAVMHGGATALFAVITHEMSERQSAAAATRYRFNPLLFAPGLAVAIVIHSTFNHFPHQPILIMAATLFLIPLTMFLTLARSEHATNRWLTADQTAHRQTLDDIRAGRFAESEAGRAIRQLMNRFKGATADDAFAYVEVKTELVLRAEELILASQVGTPVEIGAAEREKFERLGALERRLGKPVVSALSSRLGFSRNDLWELGRLRARARKTA
jgi:RsiW-degrading membrane proteinase PrsW (M82 family)